MRVAIVDNSTLTAVQRLTGSIPVANLYELSGDIDALESLLRAILFYDELFYVDDYKPEFRADRRAAFPFIHPLEASQFAYDGFVQAARATTEDIYLKVTAGYITEDTIAEYFNQLGLQTTFTWDMSSSEFFLVMKMLKGGEYGDDIDPAPIIHSGG